MANQDAEETQLAQAMASAETEVKRVASELKAAEGAVKTYKVQVNTYLVRNASRR